MSNEAVKQALLAGLGFSIIPLIGIKNELKNKDLQIIPVNGLPVRNNWYLVWLKSKKTFTCGPGLPGIYQETQKRTYRQKFQLG